VQLIIQIVSIGWVRLLDFVELKRGFELQKPVLNDAKQVFVVIFQQEIYQLVGSFEVLVVLDVLASQSQQSGPTEFAPLDYFSLVQLNEFVKPQRQHFLHLFAQLHHLLQMNSLHFER